MANHINPSPESFRALRELDRAGPIQMLNLVKLRAQADYEDGTQATGAEAYATYGKLSGPIFRGLGGRIIWSGTPEQMLIGPEETEDWDIAFIAEYPDIAAFVSMVRDPAYQAVTHHRTAAVENSRLIRLKPSQSGAGFGG
ncbi:MAG: DUF1330 domain-containing protein [Alphaproteobacteria bacterium]|nr:DUF1330 domain-containing protein [Alphaproteobacteria bacterium]